MSASEESMSPYAWGEAQSAKTFALIGFIFFAIVTAIWGMVTLGVAISVVFFAGSMPFVFPFIFPFGVFLALGVALSVWAWITMKDIEAGRYKEAQTASLVLGILGLFGNLISGIFFLLAYSKLGHAIAYAQAPPSAYQPAAPTTGRICTECGRPIAMDAKFCPHCGKELS